VKFCIFVGVNAGGYVGWSLAQNYGIMAAFIASAVGSVVGVYAGWRLGRAVLS
jgi:membrane protein DedA with SNARE-associated domain